MSISFIKKTFLLLLILSIPHSLYASSIDPSLEKTYSKFVYKVQQKYSQGKELSYLKNLGVQLEKILETKKLSTKKKKLIEDLQKLNYEKVFSIELEKKEQMRKSSFQNFPISENFSHKIISENNIFLENNIWYTYRYSNYKFFPIGTSIREGDLIANSININDDVISINDDKNLIFISDYKKVKLINNDIIFGIPNKLNFLKELKDDKKSLDYETDSLFQELQNKTLEITTGLKKEQKIQKIYDFVLNNIQYTNPLDLSDMKIFSGIDSYKNKDGVCEGYTKLFSYMLSFAGIDDHEVIRGYVINAPDFPNIGHAWVRVGDKYYDPTFDDPIGSKKTRQIDEYFYYGLPKDLLYTNRFDYSELKNSIKESSFDYRKNLVKYNRGLLVSKYKTEKYNILNEYKFRAEHELNPFQEISLNILKDIIPYYSIDDYSFVKDGKKQYIKQLNYYTLSAETLGGLLEQLQYNFDGYYLFNWKLDDGSYEYRLGYNLEFH